MSARHVPRCLLQLIFAYLEQQEVVCSVKVCHEWHVAAQTAPCYGWNASIQQVKLASAASSPLARQHVSNIIPWVSVEHLPLVHTWNNLARLNLHVDGLADNNKDEDNLLCFPPRVTFVLVLEHGSPTGTMEMSRVMRGISTTSRLESVWLNLRRKTLLCLDLSPLCHLPSLHTLDLNCQYDGGRHVFSAAQVSVLVELSSRLVGLTLDSAASCIQLLQGGAQFPLLEKLKLYIVRGQDIAPLVEHITSHDTIAPCLSHMDLSFRDLVTAAEISLFGRIQRVTSYEIDADHVGVHGLVAWTHVTSLDIYADTIATIVLPPRIESVKLSCKLTRGLAWLAECTSPLLIRSIHLENARGLQESDLIHLQGLRHLRTLHLPIGLVVSPLL
jgi:hypothetical protein